MDRNNKTAYIISILVVGFFTALLYYNLSGFVVRIEGFQIWFLK